MSTFPRLYEPSVRRIAWPVAMLMLLGWIGLLAAKQEVPVWLEGPAAADLFIVVNCRASTDPSGAVLLRAMAFSAQWFFAVLIALWFTYTVVAEAAISFHATTLLWMVLGFSTMSEAAYAFFRGEAAGVRWLVGVLPAVALVVLSALSFS
ncbi:MAG TPA: hypothetical protein PLZ25_13615 [Flavobacteriales bacterium]|nr:hypothetical protein [Flavobacteriales bacterium]HRO40945.1 hypothetical protein [Flavobacteriales bacterium]